MRPDEIRMVQAAWRTLLPAADNVAAIFFHRLFKLEPSLKTTAADAALQRKRLLLALNAAVYGLSCPEGAAGAAARVRAAVPQAGWASLTFALLWTLERMLGRTFTPQAKAAWESMCAVLAAQERSDEAGADRARTALVA